MGLQRFMLLAALLSLIETGVASTAYAIPAFSREHNTECATCHTIFPELNEYGDAFLKNGFVWNKLKKAADTANTPAIKGEGDPEILGKLKEMAMPGTVKPVENQVAAGKSEPLWLAGLPQTVPISISATLNASYRDDVSYDKVDLSTRALSLLAGGVIRDRLGFFLKYNLYAEGVFDPAIGNTPLNASAPYANDLEEFYLFWRNVLGTPLNIKGGRFRPTLSLWKKSNKVGISDFATSSFSVGDSQYRADSAADAVEVNSILLGRGFVAAGIVDRKGQDANEGYGHISVKFGGSDFRANEPEIDLDKESILDYIYLTLGGYGYVGRNSRSLASTQRNNFYRAGADIDLVIKNSRLRLGFAREEDTNPDFASHAKAITDTWMAECDYTFDPEIIAFARYEMVSMTDGSRIHRYIPGVAYAPMQNVKLTLEYQHSEHDNVSTANSRSNTVLLGARAAF